MPRTPADMRAAVERNMKEQTGKTVEQWVAVVAAVSSGTARS
jgi:hypothetical protein